MLKFLLLLPNLNVTLPNIIFMKFLYLTLLFNEIPFYVPVLCGDVLTKIVAVESDAMSLYDIVSELCCFGRFFCLNV